MQLLRKIQTALLPVEKGIEGSLHLSNFIHIQEVPAAIRTTQEYRIP